MTRLPELLELYERLVRDADARLGELSESLRERAYYETGAFEYRVILRCVWLKAGLPICWGATACVEYPNVRCKSGQHETCSKHAGSCFLCVEADKPE